MIRLVVILLASILLITVLRAVVGLILKGFADLVRGGNQRPASGPGQAQVPLSGELKRDPVCGTFVSTTSSVKKTAGGQVLHFCSVECRDKHRA